MSSELEGYFAYMLRLWQVGGNDAGAWRASLESPHTGERHGFSNLELLFAFLEEKTAKQVQIVEDSDPAPPRPKVEPATDRDRSIAE